MKNKNRQLLQLCCIGSQFTWVMPTLMLSWFVRLKFAKRFSFSFFRPFEAICVYIDAQHEPNQLESPNRTSTVASVWLLRMILIQIYATKYKCNSAIITGHDDNKNYNLSINFHFTLDYHHAVNVSCIGRSTHSNANFSNFESKQPF